MTATSAAPSLQSAIARLVASPPTTRRQLAKRVLDVVGALLLLVLLAPLLGVIALMVRWSSPGPVIFRQERVGLNGRRFRLLKFRSMVADAAQVGPWNTQADDPRVTTVGRVLRRASLDELPQLVNVLRGEMSLVGPRPIVPRQLADYNQGQLALRHSVRPGLTGWAQVRGRSNLPAEETMYWDLRYAREAGALLDLAILARTLVTVFAMRGVN